MKIIRTTEYEVEDNILDYAREELHWDVNTLDDLVDKLSTLSDTDIYELIVPPSEEYTYLQTDC